MRTEIKHEIVTRKEENTTNIDEEFRPSWTTSPVCFLIGVRCIRNAQKFFVHRISPIKSMHPGTVGYFQNQGLVLCSPMQLFILKKARKWPSYAQKGI